MEHFFPQSQMETCAQMHIAHQSQIIERDTDEDHTQIIGGDISPPGFGTPAYMPYIIECRILTGSCKCDFYTFYFYFQ